MGSELRPQSTHQQTSQQLVTPTPRIGDLTSQLVSLIINMIWEAVYGPILKATIIISIFSIVIFYIIRVYLYINGRIYRLKKKNVSSNRQSESATKQCSSAQQAFFLSIPCHQCKQTNFFRVEIKYK